MADEVLHVKKRDTRGTREARRLRRDGGVPAVLYGHGEDTVSITVPLEEFEAVMRHGARMVELAGDLKETALLRDVQWDTFGTEVLHIDFTRVSRHERVEVTVSIELRGEAPGVKQGGMIEQVTHELEIECPAGMIPEHIEVNINELELHQSLSIEDLELPEGAKPLGDTAQTVVQCIEPVEVPVEEEEEALAGEAVEPEMVGREAKEEGEAAEGEEES